MSKTAAEMFVTKSLNADEWSLIRAALTTHELRLRSCAKRARDPGRKAFRESDADAARRLRVKLQIGYDSTGK